jgi:hypothetical protein
MAWRGISGNVRVLLCVNATADLLRPLSLKRDLAAPDCGTFPVASLDLMFPAFTTPACSLSPRIQHSPLPSSATRPHARRLRSGNRACQRRCSTRRRMGGGWDGDPAGLVPVVSKVEWEVGGAAPTQRLPPPTRGRRAARWRGHFCLRTLGRQECLPHLLRHAEAWTTNGGGDR